VYEAFNDSMGGRSSSQQLSQLSALGSAITSPELALRLQMPLTC